MVRLLVDSALQMGTVSILYKPFAAAALIAAVRSALSKPVPE